VNSPFRALLPGFALLLAACQPASAPTQVAAPTQPAAAPPTTVPKPAATTVAVPTQAAAPAQAPAPTQTQAVSTPAAPTPAATVATVSLKASYSNPIATNLPSWMAFEAGIYKQHGLDVELANIASSTGVPALLSGDVAVGQLGGSEVISADAGGGDLVIIGITGPVYPFVFMAQPGITTIEQLKGKKIGVSNVGSSSDIATRVMLRKVGLDAEKDVTIVAVGSLQNRIAALLSGAIDGGVAQPPEQLGLEDKGLHIIYDLAAQKLPAASDAIVAKRTWLNANKDVAQRYVDSIVESVALSRRDKPQAIKVLQKYLKNDDERALGTTYDFFVGQATPTYPVVKAENFADVMTQLSATNDKIKDFDLSSVLDNSLVQSAMDRHVGGQ
jgi:NitT/TauT family transport system substrate-binding protein